MSDEIETCTWREDADGNWWTDCGNGMVFTDGSPLDNKQSFCGYCGKRLTQVEWSEPAPEDEDEE